MDKRTAIEHATEYARAVKKEFSPKSIMMFGSYANGTPHEWSDIDVAVIFDGFNGDWWETSTQLWRLKWGTDSMIEPHLLDISCDPSGFVKEVMKTGMVINV